MSDSREIVPFADIKQMAEVMGKNKMFGKTSEELLPLMLIAQAEGKHPAIAAQEYDVIQGRPAINSKSALARFQIAGGSIAWGKRTDTEVSATFTHAQGGSLTVTWTMDRAKKAGLDGKDNWRKYPAQMLSARVIAEGVRAVFPACLSGLYTVEETQDMIAPFAPMAEPTKAAEEPQMRNVTPEAPGPLPEAPPVANSAETLASFTDFVILVNESVPSADKPEWMNKGKGDKSADNLAALMTEIRARYALKGVTA